MKVTREVIDDLLPAYFSGEASADTRQLVEEYFQHDPVFEREARRAAETLHSIAHPPSIVPDAQMEKAALKRAKRLLRLQAILLAVASTLSLNAISLGFSFEIGSGHTRVHWLAYPGQQAAVVALLILAAVFWVFYYRTRRRVRARVLG